jgi:hypothetical protein
MKELCYALGISETMAYRLKERGMPTHSIEAAERWRAGHLEPTRTKQYREDGNPGIKAGRGAPGVRRGSGGMTVDEACDGIERMFAVDIPHALCDPMVIMAVASDAGLQLDGRQVLRLAQHLFLLYHRLFTGPEERIQVPPGLNFHPLDERFDQVAQIIENAFHLIPGENHEITTPE